MAHQSPWRLQNAERSGMSPLRRQWQRLMDLSTPGYAELKEAIEADPNNEDRVLISNKGNKP